MSSPFRIEMGEAFGLSVTYVLGLNIFYGIPDSVSDMGDPRMVFIRELARGQETSAILGGVALVDSRGKDDDTYRKHIPNMQRLNVGLVLNGFYNLDTYPGPSAWFVPSVGETRLFDSGPENVLDTLHVIDLDALALLVGTDRNLRAEDFPAFARELGWMEAVSELCSLLVMTSGDGMYIEIYSRHADILLQITLALESAGQAVEKSAWYQEHQPFLLWDDMNRCLGLPRLELSALPCIADA